MYAIPCPYCKETSQVPNTVWARPQPQGAPVPACPPPDVVLQCAKCKQWFKVNLEAKKLDPDQS